MLFTFLQPGSFDRRRLSTVITEISLCYLKAAKPTDAAKHFVRGVVGLMP